jgi:FtsP/CotA-like multicopper oxidase with cupredoxin domain
MRDNERRAPLTRRQGLASGVAIAGAISFLSITRATAAPEKRAANLRLTAGTRTLDVNGKPARVFGLIGPNGKPGVTLSPGERFHVDVVNEAGTSTIIHWHGQLPPWRQDGFPWSQTPPIPAGDTHSYDYAPIAGTFWMHSHQGIQEQSLMAAPLIVHNAEDIRADRQEVVLMLHDFSFHTPDELLAGLTRSNSSQSAMPKSAMDKAMNMGPGKMATMNMGSAMAMDLNDVDYDAFLANDRTLADPEVIRTEPGGRVRLRLINAASSTQFWIDLGALSGTVVAADGHPVRPVRVTGLPLAMAQRLDVLIDLPGNGAYPIFARVEGKRARTGIVLATSGAPVSRLAAEDEENAPPINLSLERRPLQRLRKRLTRLSRCLPIRLRRPAWNPKNAPDRKKPATQRHFSTASTHFGSRRLSKKFQSPRPNAFRPSDCRVLFLSAGLWWKDHRLDFNSYRRVSNELQLYRRIWSVAPVQPVGASIAFSAGPDSRPRFFQEERRS